MSKTTPIEAINMAAKNTPHSILIGIAEGSTANPIVIPIIPTREIILVLIIVLLIFKYSPNVFK